MEKPTPYKNSEIKWLRKHLCIHTLSDTNGWVDSKIFKSTWTCYGTHSHLNIYPELCLQWIATPVTTHRKHLHWYGDGNGKFCLSLANFLVSYNLWTRGYSQRKKQANNKQTTHRERAHKHHAKPHPARSRFMVGQPLVCDYILAHSDILENRVREMRLYNQNGTSQTFRSPECKTGLPWCYRKVDRRGINSLRWRSSQATLCNSSAQQIPSFLRA